MTRNAQAEFCPRITRIDANNSVSGSRARAAFSLIEVMVAVSLLAVIIVGLLAMFYQTQRAFRTGMAQVDVLEGGRATLDLISRELQEMSASYDQTVTNLSLSVRFGAPRGPGVPIQLPGGYTSDDSVLQDVTFLRHLNDEWWGESYRVYMVGDKRGPTAGLNVQGLGTLWRLIRTNHWRGLSDLNTDLVAKTPDGHTNFSRIADGVVHFRVLPYDENGILITNSTPTTVFNRQTGSYTFVSNALPASIEVELAIVEPRILEQFNARTNNMQAALDYLSRQAGHIQFLKQRITIRNSPRLVVNTP